MQKSDRLVSQEQRTPLQPRVALETLGCKLNLADSEQLSREFLQAGFRLVQPDDETDVYVLNTCTVTHVADRKARQRLRAVRRRLPEAYIVATGCYPERDAAALNALTAVDLVAGNSQKPELVQLIAKRLPERLPTARTPHLLEPMPVRTEPPAARSRAFVKIQEGCNDYCAYCIIPKTRGTSRFFAPDAIVADILEREAAGYQEIVLTGTQLGDYGIAQPGDRRQGPDHRDQETEGNPLAALLGTILSATRVPRIRISSLQPQDLTPTLLALWDNSRLCQHFHLPLQNGSDRVLERMRRRYTSDQYVAAVQRVRERMPDSSITTDLIVGFPGETASDFEHTLRLCETLAFADIHVFPYSVRPGTLAAQFKHATPDPLKQERLQRLLSIGKSSSTAHRSRFLGATRPVLWEESASVDGGLEWNGLTDNYIRIHTRSPHLEQGMITPTKLTALSVQGLWGEMAP